MLDKILNWAYRALAFLATTVGKVLAVLAVAAFLVLTIVWYRTEVGAEINPHKIRRQDQVTITWATPIGTYIDGQAVVEGRTSDAKGNGSAWAELCRMSRGGASFKCSFDVPVGKVLEFAVIYSSGTIRCEVGDTRYDPPCGGKGKPVGEITALQASNDLTVTTKASGVAEIFHFVLKLASY